MKNGKRTLGLGDYFLDPRGEGGGVMVETLSGLIFLTKKEVCGRIRRDFSACD